MANFEQKKQLETVENHVEVTSAGGQPLRPGLHVFQLVVEDQAGNRSAPATIEVIVRDTTAPTAILRLVVPEKQDPAAWPQAGKAFELSAEGSSDADGGQIARYIWTLVEAPSRLNVVRPNVDVVLTKPVTDLPIDTPPIVPPRRPVDR
jgi:hypothetical protein